MQNEPIKKSTELCSIANSLKMQFGEKYSEAVNEIYKKYLTPIEEQVQREQQNKQFEAALNSTWKSFL